MDLQGIKFKGRDLDEDQKREAACWNVTTGPKGKKNARSKKGLLRTLYLDYFSPRLLRKECGQHPMMFFNRVNKDFYHFFSP